MALSDKDEWIAFLSEAKVAEILREPVADAFLESLVSVDMLLQTYREQTNIDTFIQEILNWVEQLHGNKEEKEATRDAIVNYIPTIDFDPKIRNKCNQAVQTINNLEERIKTLTDKDEIERLNEQIDQLFSYLCQQSSMDNMDLSAEQRVALNRVSRLIEGIHGQKLCLYRVEKCRVLYDQLSQPTLIYGLPGSGKTVLLQQFSFYAILVKNKTVVTINCAGYQSLKPTESEFDRFVSVSAFQYRTALLPLLPKNQPADVETEQLTNKFRSILMRPGTIVILDDAQCVYGLSDIMDHFKAQSFLCFSSNGLQSGVGLVNTPMLLTLNMPAYSLLLYSRSELRRLAQIFLDTSKENLSESLQDEIYATTGGHPGFVRQAFYVLTTRCRKDGIKLSSNLGSDLYSHFMQSSNFLSIDRIIRYILRAVHQNDMDQEPMVRKLVLKCLYEMIMQKNPLYTNFIDSISDDNKIARKYVDLLTKMGIFNEIGNSDDKVIRFAIPLFEFIYKKDEMLIRFQRIAMSI